MAKKIHRPIRRPAFFKALMGDFSQQLRIPSAFIKKLNGFSPHQLKGPSGECCDVELEKRGNQMFFHRGWEKFVQRHYLEAEDFLIFSYDGVSMFNVRIYGKKFCLKNAEAGKSRSKNAGRRKSRNHKVPRRRYTHAHKKVEVGEEPIIPFQSKNPFVYRTLKTDSSLHEVYVPRDVVRKEGYENGMTLMIIGAFGMSWNVTLCGTLEAGRVMMRSGLPNICRANKAKAGDTVIFEFVTSGLVKLHVIKAGAK